ncbi:MAG: bifunctional UDP-N-acetylglucosamine diphosphorylase/glucosamine-1-phosphate N-acetyltransferase GlmU [Myxococcota bacterium]
MNEDVVAIVLAAGQGTRMKSALPKVLHRIAGRTLAAWSVQAAKDAGAKECVVVVGHAREQVEAELTTHFGSFVRFALQAEQKGTGHAVQCALTELTDFEGRLLILYGDCPAVPPKTLRSLLEQSAGRALGIVTSTLEDPTGYGRILRTDGNVAAVREERDCSDEERRMKEVNPGIYAVATTFLRTAIQRLQGDNAQGELYLTDVVAMAAEEAKVADVAGDMRLLQGVNDRWQLASCAEVLRARINESLARAGAGLVDPSTTSIDADCEVEPDATIEAGVHLRGRCVIRSGARIDVGCVLENVEVDAGAYLKPYTVAADSRIGPRAQVGPFAHLRPKSELGADTKVGNFCETKKTRLGEGSKVNHLAYVGDGVIGKGVNVGAGVIFCNYDGVQKHTTVLEDGAFVGSDSQLVAPVTVGEGAYVASGSTITKDVPKDALAIARHRKQENKEGYASKLRARFAAAKAAKKSSS